MRLLILATLATALLAMAASFAVNDWGVATFGFTAWCVICAAFGIAAGFGVAALVHRVDHSEPSRG